MLPPVILGWLWPSFCQSKVAWRWHGTLSGAHIAKVMPAETRPGHVSTCTPQGGHAPCSPKPQLKGTQMLTSAKAGPGGLAPCRRALAAPSHSSSAPIPDPHLSQGLAWRSRPRQP